MFKFFLILGSLGLLSLNAESFRPYEQGPVHEAYIQKTNGNIALEAVPSDPPAPITERIPPQPDEQSLWIPGYWAWIPDINDFVWVGGAWRKPPPGHQWISGYWKQFEEGWAWVSGFWSPNDIESIDYVDIPPPDSVDEEIPPQPAPDTFWSPGFWVFAPEPHEYYWVEGYWENLDPNWILVPAHYVWRPEGYVYIAAYWDWPAEGRGPIYSCLFIDPPARVGFIYQPIIIIEPLIVVRRCFAYYPDYNCFFWHHYHYHHEWWDSFADTPPWWGWPSWWCYTWHDQWGLWWWYGHPGYPQPHWMTMEMASKIAPPPDSLFKLFKKIKTPFVVTPNGVVAPSKIFKALGSYEGKGKFVPVLPGNKNLLDKIKINADPEKKDPKRIIRPLGNKSDLIKIKAGKLTEPKKPVIKPEVIVKKIPKGLEDKVKIRKDSVLIPPKPSKDSKPRLPNTKLQDSKIKPVKPIFKQDNLKQDGAKDDSVKPKEIKPIFKKPEDNKIRQPDTAPKIIKEPTRPQEKIIKKSDSPTDPFYRPTPPKEKFIQVDPSKAKQDPKIYTPPNKGQSNQQQPFYQPKGNVKEDIRVKVKQPEVQPPVRVYKQNDNGRRKNKNDN